MRLSVWFSRLFVLIGVICFLVVGIGWMRAASFQERASRVLEQELVTSAPPSRAHLDNTLIGRLEIPRLKLSVIVMDGDDEATLAKAVGLVRGTSRPWEEGNAVIAGHRDTFFRPLRNLRHGDEIRMTTARGTYEYRVTGTEIVQPDNLAVLAPTPTRTLTLLTCYPFVYVGHAPQRFIAYAAGK